MMDPAEMSKPEKIAKAIQLRARGHALRWIADRLGEPKSTVHDWLTARADEVGQVAREELPDLEDDARLSRLYLRERLLDDEAPGPERDKVAAVLLGNHNRATEVAAKAKEADAATSQAKTAAELAQLEADAQAYLAKARKRQSGINDA